MLTRCWREGRVDTDGEHFKLTYTSKSAPDEVIEVALVGLARDGAFSVEFVIDVRRPDCAEIIKDVRREITYYLVGLGESDPWRYARYHCGAAANLYSSVHWSHVPGRE